MRVLIDTHIPFIKGVFEPYAEVSYLEGKEIKNGDLLNTDVLIIRTRTKCTPTLLKNTGVKLIATATIGTDHIDLDYCNKVGIKVISAPGCNSGGVLQYVFTALYYLYDKKSIVLPLKDESILGKKVKMGVIGVGNVGSKVADFAELLGYEVYRCDPKKEREQTINFNNGNLRLNEFKDFYSLDYLLENSDVLSVNVCLTSENIKFINGKCFDKIKKGCIFINTSRGEVVDELALLRNLDKLSGVILDVWENEPFINLDLLNKVDVATPHIAGYSLDGKINGTTMVVKGVADFFKIKALGDFKIQNDNPNRDSVINFKGLSQKELFEYFMSLYKIDEDINNLKNNFKDFENLRSNYNYRREFYVNKNTATTIKK